MNSPIARSGFSSFAPASARNIGLPEPSAIAARPGAASAMVAIAIATGTGCQRYGLIAVGMTVARSVDNAKAVHETIDWR